MKLAVFFDGTWNEPSTRTNVWKLRQDLDCSAVCARFGGGGHKRAAGCTLEADTPEEAFSLIVKAFSEIV